ncbi:MAG TPA: xanthine dehydrogenase family protein subunit M [Syntrophorhabdaceae bacterium]|nr:xanthine dehydrogenase family protein subunit M [Syntrophorhabdaceae bacterium]HON84962.1 xanthine dehydrogenase family protein subunit M [Syntrophorhabdaceae bacterium]HOT41699.1 xanthine dehydrogenase family protein subunit M [Syntrophorhabdaceae bacterium]HPC66609.1 xanthine dehydrogenase family protein subunit M [Syntrophorhabdaceae bacterium]HQE79642.1 xanthine dehydrogenase family protein subunit M [Syntrophorhabdaceae bacterium]
MRGFEYYKPKTVKEAIELMVSLENAKFIAGGTDIMVLMRQKKISPQSVVSLRNIPELAEIDTKDGLRIGSCVTHNDIDKNEYIKKYYSALTDATSQLGSRQIRNVATIGGNICNAAPSADTACPLLVLDAKAVIIGQDSSREVDLDEFFLGPGKTVLSRGEILKEFIMPRFNENTGSSYIKHTRREAMDLPILGVATRITISITSGNEVRCRDMFCTIDSISNILERLKDEGLRCEDVRIAMGVVAPRPIRAKKAEAALKGKIVTPELFEEIGEIAASEAQPRDSVRGEAWYRREMIKVLVKRSLAKSMDRVIRPDEAIYPERLW